VSLATEPLASLNRAADGSVYRSLHAYRHGYKLGRPCGLARHQQFEYDARAIRPDLISSVGSFSSVDNDSCWIVRPSIRRSCVRDKQISDGGRAPSLPTRDRLTARHPCICLRNRRPTIAYQASRISRAEDAGCHNGPAGAPPATPSLVYIYQKHDGGGTSRVPDRRLASCL